MSHNQPPHDDSETFVPPPDTRRLPHAISPEQRRKGLLALLIGFVLLAVLVAVARTFLGGGGAPGANPAPTPSYAADPAIPEEAKSKVYTSNVASSGTYVANTITAEPAAKASKTNPYLVKVESSLNTDPDAVARFVQSTLDNQLGWASYGKNNFKLVNTEADGQLTIVLATPKTIDAACGAELTKGLWDCRKGNQIFLNSDRWFYLVPSFEGDKEKFRAYQVNHQVGYVLGQKKTVCKKKGENAPVMADQINKLDGCLANAWPKSAT